MRKLFTLLFLLFSLCGFAQTTWYIDPAGNDVSGLGTQEDPWKSLHHACEVVTDAGDIIHVNAGTYNETYRANVAVGVSIVGEGVTSYLRYTYAPESTYDACIYLNSSPTITAGNQSISYLRIDGNNRTATRAILVYYRSNVEIHHCTIEYFLNSGIYAGVASLYLTPPAAYVPGINIHDCIFYDLSIYSGVKGHIILEGTDGTLIYNNSFTQTNRVAGENGTIITSNFTKGWQLYNNTLTKNSDEATQWNFFIESWHFMGGCDIYGNTFNGGAVNDIVNVEKGAYGYGLKVYDNDFLIVSQISKGSRTVQALDFEERGKYESIYIYNNYFKNYPNPIYLLATMNEQDVYINDIYIYCNIMENCGYSNYTSCYAIFFNGENETYDGYVDNINIWNNTIIGNPGKSNVGIRWQVYGDVTNVSIRDNIIQGFNNYPIQFAYQLPGGNVDVLSVENNLYYSNGTDAGYYSGATITNKTEQNNVTGNPLFVSSTDFHLTSVSSPAYHAGIDVGLVTDYDGMTFNSPPTIGAYEYEEALRPPYYIATNGNDVTGDGSIGNPWASWSKIGDITLYPGDIVYIRGGTYRTTGDGSTTVHVRWDGINGTINDTIKIMAYPGETPILNLDNITQTAQYSYIIFIQNSNYLHIKGLRVTGLPQFPYGNSGTLSYGFRLSGSSHNLIEFNEADHLAFRGYSLESGSNYNLFLNCDAHHLKDPYSADDPYGGADGFGRTGGSTATGNVFRNCRAWLCSDDGWDHYSTDGYTYIEGCWSFWNGYLDEARTQPAGDGTGFKLGPGNTNLTIASRIVTNCLAVQNRANGLDQNFYEGVGEFASHIYNNTMYGNGQYGFRMRPYGTSNGSNADIIRNNIAYLNTGGTYLGDAGDTQDHNTWNGLVTLTSADFVSLNTAVLDDARQADGSLPDITLLHLATGSDLIDAGIDVGLPYENAPDMGCFEYIGGIQIVLPTVTTTIISGIGDSYATGGGNVTSSGNGTVSARGVCWYTSLNPTILYDHTTDGTGIGAFASSLTDLYEYTHYYVRAYATNEIGTSYGSNREFTTLEHEEPEPPPGVGIILIDKDGNVLKSPDGIHLLKPNNP